MKKSLTEGLRTFWAALGFLSIVPTGRDEPLSPEELGRFPAFYPLVGLMFGLDLWIMWHLAGLVLPPRGAAVLVVTLLVVLNRGFHLDGLADTADALFSHKSREQKLLIMKDSRQGTFGVLAIVLDIVLKIELVAIVGPIAAWALILWPAWGRLAASAVAAGSRYVGSESGLGRWMVENSSRKELFFAALFTLCASLFIGLIVSAFAAGAAVITALSALFFGFFLIWTWVQALDGVTGDLLGASIELAEIFSLFMFYVLITM